LLLLLLPPEWGLRKNLPGEQKPGQKHTCALLLLLLFWYPWVPEKKVPAQNATFQIGLSHVRYHSNLGSVLSDSFRS
jgi:hypothetical protein